MNRRDAVSADENGRDACCDLVLLHGGWHCGASWGEVVPLLQARGHCVIAPDLPGHGWRARFPAGYFDRGQPGLTTARSAIGDITLDAAAADVLGVLRAVRGASGGARPMVLVAHSISGVVASLVAETAPGLVDHLVYIAAMVPSRLRSSAAYSALPEYGSQTMDGLLVGDPAVTGTLRINPWSADPRYRDLLRRKFYGDVPRAEADAFAHLLSADLPLSFAVEEVAVTPDRWGSIPRTYVHTTRDFAIAPAVQVTMIRDADALAPRTAFRQVTMDTGHSPFASRPWDVADIIAGAGAYPASASIR
jgi:pimeloyl-ACP methyl ester carboxylesterase